MVSRGQHVSHMMLKTICGCRSNKVDDKESVPVVDSRDTVLVLISPSVLSRSLLGHVFNALERTDLRSTAINFLKPLKETLQKSSLIKKNSADSTYAEIPCVVSLWKGPDAYRKVAEAIAAFSAIYSISRADIIWTETTTATRKEVGIWFSPSSLFPPVSSTSSDPPANGEAPKVEAAPDAVEVENVQEERDNVDEGGIIENENIIVQGDGGEITTENVPPHETQEPPEEQAADTSQVPTQTS